MDTSDKSFTYYKAGTYFFNSTHRFNKLPFRRKLSGSFQIRLAGVLTTRDRFTVHVWYNNAWVLPSAVPLEKL